MKRSLFILFAIAILSGCSATVPATEIEIFEEILPDNTSITTVGDTPHLPGVLTMTFDVRSDYEEIAGQNYY